MKDAFYSTGKRLRTCEWTLIVFFLYIAAIAPAFQTRTGSRFVPIQIAVVAIASLLILAHAEERGLRRFVSYARDWVTLALVFAAYREMDWFTPRSFVPRLENYWIVWDRTLLHEWGLRQMIEATGALIPSLLELSYLLVYAVGPFTIAILYILRRRDRMGWVLFLYALGTLAAYGLFPYFPSSPPRVVFPGMDLPTIVTPLRRFNLFLVGGYGIHSSVFPSAHVSSAFSAGWALLIFLPDKSKLGWSVIGYAALVAIATVYGRYHYAVDALAGIGVSLAAASVVLVARRQFTATACGAGEHLRSQTLN